MVAVCPAWICHGFPLTGQWFRTDLSVVHAGVAPGDSNPLGRRRRAFAGQGLIYLFILVQIDETPLCI